MAWGLFVACVAMVLYSVGALLQADGTRRATRRRPVAVQPRFLGGILVDFVAWLFAVVALRHLPVFAVQAVIGGSIALTVVAGARLAETRLDRSTRLAVGASMVGLGVVAASAGGERPYVASRSVDIVLIGGLLALGVAGLVLRQYRHAWPLAVVAGMGFGGTALAVRAAHVEIGAAFAWGDLLAQPAIYLVAGFWVVGMIAYPAALSRGDVGSVTAMLVVTQVVFPGLVGIALLGDPVRDGWGWPFALGLLVAVAGVVVLARRPLVRTPRVRRGTAASWRSSTTRSC